ncbi:MAG TPA: aldo/keto reductase [Baekduia sp.]|nr:aldo/keto reductase [Baekduia sp.]
MANISGTDLDVFGLCLGTNVFGWTAGEDDTFAVLDQYLEAGGNFLDTADVYSAWVDGNEGGESETLIGRWMADRGVRDRVVVATKVGSMPGLAGLRADTIRAAVEDSLRRLRVDAIDLLYAHKDDPDTPQEETLAAFDALVREGKVRHIAASNFTADRLRSALDISEREGLARYVALQPMYNLLERDIEGELLDLCAERDVAVIPYYGLARGFLTGKYRPGGPAVDSPRAGAAAAYLEDPAAVAALERLDAIAAARDTTPSAVALAWVRQQPAVAAPIASARSVEQLEQILPGATLELSGDEIADLRAAAQASG